MIDDNLIEWLGHAATVLTPEQIERIADASRDIDERYPYPDEHEEREAALTATVQHILKDTTIEDVNRALIAARRAAREAYAVALQTAVMLVSDGHPKAAAARLVGIDRMGLLKALGER